MFSIKSMVFLVMVVGVMHGADGQRELFEKLFSSYIKNAIVPKLPAYYEVRHHYVPCRNDPKICAHLVALHPDETVVSKCKPYGFVLFHTTDNGIDFNTYCGHGYIETKNLSTLSRKKLDEDFGGGFTCNDIINSFKPDVLASVRDLAPMSSPYHWVMSEENVSVLRKERVSIPENNAYSASYTKSFCVRLRNAQ